jgi:O-antigen/teichoic acid export membrane protein
MSILHLIKSSGVRNFTKLLSANVVAQVIGLVVYPILTRIYAPEDFGLLNLFLSIGNVLIVLSIADYYYAIVLPKEEKDATSLTYVSLSLLIITTLLTVITIIFSQPISMLFKSPDLAKYYWIMPLYVFVMGAWNILNYWYIRQKAFGGISGYQISQSVLSAGSKIGFGYAGILHGGMIYSIVIAPFVSLMISLWRGVKSAKFRCFDRFDYSHVIATAKQYRNFPLYVLPRSFINVLATQLPILLLTPFFGAEKVGLLSMALLLGYTPIGTITRAFYQVLYQHTTSRVHTATKIGDVLGRFVGYGTIVIVPLFVGLGVVLPTITAWLLGEEWRVVGEYIRWMLPWLYVSLLTGSVCFLSDVFMQQKKGLFFEILLAVCRAAGLCIGIVVNDFTIAIAAYSIGSAIAVLAQLIWLASLVRRYDQSLVRVG